MLHNYKKSENIVFLSEFQIIDLKEEIHQSTIIFGDFNTPLLVMDSIIRKKISKDTEDLNNTFNHLI